MTTPQPETHRLRLKLGDSFVHDHSTPCPTEAARFWEHFSAEFDALKAQLPHQDVRLTWSRNGILDRHRQYVGVTL